MNYTYLLGDDGGVSNCENVEILLPIGTMFRHEFGIYVVTDYIDRKDEFTTKFSQIDRVLCERKFSNEDIRQGKHKQS